MAFRNPSLDQWGRDNPQAGLGLMLNAWGTPVENRSLQTMPMTDEQYALLLNGQVAKKSRALQTQGDIQRAQQQSRFLDSITPYDTAGIHMAPNDPRQSDPQISQFQLAMRNMAPNDPRQAQYQRLIDRGEQARAARQTQLQALINQDTQARQLGSNLSMSGILRNRELDRQMLPYNLDVAKFKAEEAQRKFANDLNLKEYLSKGADADALMAYHNRVLDQNAQQHSDALQYTANRDTRAEQYANNAAFTQIEGALKTGQLDPESALASSDRFTPQQKAVIQSYVKKNADAAQFADALAKQYTGMIQAKTAPEVTPADPGQWRALIPFVGTHFLDRPAKTIEPSPEQTAMAIAAVEKDQQKNAQARNMIYFDPNTNQFYPNPRYAMPHSSPVRSGSFSDAMTNAPSDPYSSGPMLGPRYQGPPTAVEDYFAQSQNRLHQPVEQSASPQSFARQVVRAPVLDDGSGRRTGLVDGLYTDRQTGLPYEVINGNRGPVSNADSIGMFNTQVPQRDGQYRDRQTGEIYRVINGQRIYGNGLR